MKNSTMRKLTFIYSLFCMSIIAISQTNYWETSSYVIAFKIKNAKTFVTGNFFDLNTRITFDTLDLSKSRFEGSVSVQTINTGISIRDKHLKKSEYFNMEKHSVISIKSKSIAKRSANRYVAVCTLTIKDKEKEVELPFTFRASNGRAKFAAILTINRLDFGLGSKSVIMASSVDVLLDLNVIKK